MNVLFSISSTLLFLTAAQSSFAVQPAPLALIYKGLGSCSADQDDAGSHGYGCSEAAAVVAKRAGFRVKFVKGNALSETATEAQVDALFQNAKVWIQPGGIAVTAYEAMTNKLKNELVNFVSQGGGYVGWCAGAFMATSQIGTSGSTGFGIFPGYTNIFAADGETADVAYSFQKITWKGKVRSIYFEGGPSLSGFEETPGAEAIGLYEDGEVAAARASYGKGRVFISGPHPEAPAVWSEEDHVHDPDGSDRDLAVDMVQWASGLHSKAPVHHAGHRIH